MNSCSKPREGQSMVKKSQGTSCLFFDWGFVVAAVVFLNRSQYWFREVYFCGIECVHSHGFRHGLSLVCLLFACLLAYAHLSSFHSPASFPCVANSSHMFDVSAEFSMTGVLMREIWTERARDADTLRRKVEAEMGVMYL